MQYHKPLSLFFICLFISCTGVDLINDYVPPVLRITTPFSEITLGDSYSFEASYFNNIGEFIPNSQFEWESSDSEILTIDSNGNATPLKVGTVQIIVRTTSSEGSVLQDEINITIQSNVVLVPPEEPIEEPTEEEQIPESNTQTPTITITNGISQITAETNYQLELAFQDAMGNLADVPNSNWTSSNEALLQVDETRYSSSHRCGYGNPYCFGAGIQHHYFRTKRYQCNCTCSGDGYFLFRRGGF